jgi:phosphatidylserine decarboxylase
MKDIAPFIQKHQIIMDDFLKPAGGYQSFNDFFIRKLRPGAREINQDSDIIVSPADAKIYVIPNISTDTLFFVKHKPFNLEKFLGNQKLAEQYKNGTLIIFRLAPYDYHRFHFPADGTPSAPHIIHGRFESVNPLVLKSGIQPLTENERHIVLFKTDTFDTIAMVAVGAMMVGKIVHTYKPNTHYKKGDEAGYFAFGGSTVVLLFKHGIISPLPLFLQHSLQGLETAVKMGQAIAKKGA